VDLGLLRAASELAVGSCLPTLTILLDVPVDVVNERRAHDARDRFEAEELAFHQRVRDGYRELAQESAWFVVDGARSQIDVARVIDERVADLPW
jgi:dTMP kinase